MQCYVCAKAGKQTEAVGICIVCGMGLCMDHALREDVDLWEGGYPFPNKKATKKLPGSSARSARSRWAKVHQPASLVKVCRDSEHASSTSRLALTPPADHKPELAGRPHERTRWTVAFAGPPPTGIGTDDAGR